MFYTQSDFDDVSDNAGKTAQYDTISNIEVEAGIKIEQAFCQNSLTSKIYVKPSIVQTITNGDEVNITKLGKVSTYEDQTLGRVEVGGRLGITSKASAYGLVNYTFGEKYDALGATLGINYAF